VVISELFKIEDGKIRRIEAVMTGNLDLDAASGWGD
jgi:putative sterol carrier protein